MKMLFYGRGEKVILTNDLLFFKIGLTSSGLRQKCRKREKKAATCH